ncbi:MAG: hypothetical protein GXP26_12120 [Planctomycetes bacterium]|nr:hypothetical protein [Planctomycetota bacterium]
MEQENKSSGAERIGYGTRTLCSIMPLGAEGQTWGDACGARRRKQRHLDKVLAKRA